MGRIIIIFLLSMFIFLGGVSYGAKETTPIPPEMIETKVDETYPIIEISEAEVQPVEEELKIYQTASWFERVVTSTYDVGVRIMYQFVEIFFD